MGKHGATFQPRQHGAGRHTIAAGSHTRGGGGGGVLMTGVVLLLAALGAALYKSRQAA